MSTNNRAGLVGAFYALHSAFHRPAWLSSDSSSFVNCRALKPRGSASLLAGSNLMKNEERTLNSSALILHSAFYILHL